MTKCVVICAVILFLMTASIAEDMTPDDKLQELKDQIKNISQTIPSNEAVVSDKEVDYHPEVYEYDDEDEEDDPENPITISPIDEIKAIIEAKKLQNATQTDSVQITSRTETAASSNEDNKKDFVTATKTGNITEDDDVEVIAATKTEDIMKDTVATAKTEDMDEGDLKETPSLDTPSENLKEIKKTKLLTPIEIFADFNDTALDLEELAVVPIPKAKVEPRIVTKVINITINTEEYTSLSSDNFPEPYPDEAVNYQYILGFGPGFGVEMIVKTISFAAGDYLLIKPGGSQSSERKILFSYFLNTEKKYKLLHLNELYLEFVTSEKSEPNTYKGFDIAFRRVGAIMTTTTPEPTEPPPVTVAPRNESALFLGGKTALQFVNISEAFKNELAAIAELYCNKQNITIDENITVSDNVNYNMITRCNVDWPDSTKCVEVRYSIGVHFDDETGAYEMTVEHMNEMWKSYATKINLTEMGLYVYTPPNDQHIFWLWLGIAVGIIGVFIVVLLVMWKYRFFNQYVQTSSQRESLVHERKSNLSLFPTPFQSVPPLYGQDTYEDRVWLDNDLPRYSDEVKPSYGGGRVNQGYVRNEDFNDMYPNDMIIMELPDQKEHTEFGILPQDVKMDYDESNS